MTVSTSTNRIQYNTNGTTGPWSVPFYFLEDAHLAVTYTTGAGVATLLTLTTDYSVTGAGDPAGGLVTTVTAYGAGGKITVLRDVPATQETDYVETDSFPAAAHEAALDKLTMIVQQQNEVLDRAITFPPSENTSGVLPSAVNRAGMLCSFDASGNVTIADPGNVALSSADFAIARAKRFVVGYDDDPDITNNVQPLANNLCLARYSSDYPNTAVYNAFQAQRYIISDTAGLGGSFKAYTILGASDSSTATPVEGDYAAEWMCNMEMDNYSTQDIGAVSVGVSSTVRRYSVQGVIGIHCNAMDMRVPQTATDSDMGGITGLECHSDGIGPDHRVTGGTGHGYRQTMRLVARTQKTTPDWVKRGTGTRANGQAVALDDICLPKDAVLSENYMGTYFVCTTAGTLGGVDTVLDAATTPLTEVTDGTAVWECRVGAEIGIGIVIRNGRAAYSGPEDPAGGYYRHGLLIHNAAFDGNLNQIAHAIRVQNSGEVNYGSEGDPDYHFRAIGTAAQALIDFGAELDAGSIAKIQFRGNDSIGAASIFGSVTASIVTNTAGSEGGRLSLAATVAGAGETHVYLEGLNTVIGEKTILDTTATAGFLHIGRCAGAPTGVPDLYTGKCPMVVDSTNGRLYVYHTGAWHYAALT